MKKYWVLILCLLPFLVQAKCTLGSNTSAQQTIELDMTTVTVGSPVRLVINTNLNDTFSCNENTDFMDSSGIGVIMGRYKTISLIGGEVWAVHTNARIRKILTLSGVTKIMQIYEEEEE